MKNKPEFDKNFRYKLKQAQILVNHQDVRKIVETTRLELGLPPDGLKSSKQIAEWLENNLYYKGGNRGFRNPTPEDKRVTLNSNLIAKSKEEIVIAGKLDSTWLPWIQDYILSNKIANKSLPKDVLMITQTDEVTGATRFFVEVKPEDNSKWISANWTSIKDSMITITKKKTVKKRQPVSTAVLARDRLAYELYTANWSYKSIAAKLSPNFNGDDYQPEEISKFIERHKSRQGIN